MNRDEQRVGRREWNRKDVTTDLEAGAGLSPKHNRDETMVQPQGYIKPLFEGCMGESGPIFNFARFPRHLRMCSLVVEMFGNMNAHLHEDCRHSVSGAEWDDQLWQENFKGTPRQMEEWLFPKSRLATWEPTIYPASMLAQATLMAAFLQWGTTGAAVLLAYQTPVVGLGCVSGAYLLYGVAATLVWALLVLSAFLSHKYGEALSNRTEAAKLGHRWALTVLIPTARYLGKSIALLNALWVLTLCVLQFAGRYQNCWCMSIFRRAGWVILWATDEQIADAAWGSWIGSAVLAIFTVIVVTVFVLGGRGEEIFARQQQ